MGVKLNGMKGVVIYASEENTRPSAAGYKWRIKTQSRFTLYLGNNTQYVYLAIYSIMGGTIQLTYSTSNSSAPSLPTITQSMPQTPVGEPAYIDEEETWKEKRGP